MNDDKSPGLISVIVPVYNVEKYLERCINSIINQSYTNLEILLINDGSKDSSSDICDKYAARDPRIRVFHQANSGAALSRNIGLEHATGDYLSFVDSDDYLADDFYKELYNLMISTGSDLVQCGYYEVDEQGNKLQNEQPKVFDLESTGYDCLMNLYKSEFRPSNILFWNKLYKRQLWYNICLPNKTLHDDAYALPYIYDIATKVALTSQRLYFYTVRTGSITTTADPEYLLRKHIDLNAVYNQLYEYFKKKGYSELASSIIIEKCHEIRQAYKRTRRLKVNRHTKLQYFKKIHGDLETYLKIYLSNKDIKLRKKIRFLLYYYGVYW